jgi:PAS domain-containing protein
VGGPVDLASELARVSDAAFEAALEPGLWPDVVRGVMQIMGGDKAILLNQSDAQAPASLPAAGFDAEMVARYFERYEIVNPIQQGLAATVRQGRFAAVNTDQDLVDRARMLRTDFYNHYFRPIDIHSVLMIHIGPGRGTLNVMRPLRGGDFGEAESAVAAALQPTLRGAYLVGRRLGVERRVGESLAAFVDRLPSAVALCDRDGRVHYANDAASALFARDDGLCIRAEGIRVARAETGRRLLELIASAASADPRLPLGGAVTVPRRSGRRPFAVLAAPAHLERGGRPRLALVMIHDPELTPAAPADQLRALFGLTPAEALTVADLVAGHGPKAIAERRGVKISNIRSQLSSALAKTDTLRQSELVSLVLRTVSRFQ